MEPVQEGVDLRFSAVGPGSNHRNSHQTGIPEPVAYPNGQDLDAGLTSVMMACILMTIGNCVYAWFGFLGGREAATAAAHPPA